jgi:hypothetical protein
VSSLDEGKSQVREAYGPNYEGLSRIKPPYDPTNFFRSNQNIMPAEKNRMPHRREPGDTRRSFTARLSLINY